MSASDVARTRYGPAVIDRGARDRAQPDREADAASPPGSRVAYGLATVLVAGRWLVLAGWIAAAVFALVALPAFSTSSGGIGDITSADNPAIVAETRAAQAFGFPVLTRTMLVQHAPGGLPQPVVQKAYQAARSLQQQGGSSGGVVAALPVLDAAGVVPGSRSTGTTLVTYLYPSSGNLKKATDQAHAYAAAHFDPVADHVVGVTGTVPARYEQTVLVDNAVRVLEIVSVLGVVVIVGIAFRSVVAPAVTLACAGISAVIVTRLAGLAGSRYGVNIPPDLEPLMVALLVGVTTDYVVYFFSGLRGELLDGRSRVVAARRSVATFAPIVAAAGLTVAAGVTALLAASSPAVRLFAPAMALAVVVALVVALTFVPAVMGILGPRAFWPTVPRPGADRPFGVTVRRGLVRLVRVRAAAVVIAAACIGGLAWVALPAQHLAAGLPLIQALPADTEPARAAAAASAGFAPGIVAPTLVVVQGPAVTQHPESLATFERQLGGEQHVAGVIGPTEDAALSAQAGRPVGLFVTAAKQTAQFVVVLDVDPLDATGVAAVDRLKDRLPALLARAGLGGTTGAIGGDTAAVAALVHGAERDLAAIMLVALAVNLIILALVLRALVAPLLLLGCTVLSVAATLGLTVWLFQIRLGHPGLTFFVPLAAGVLLVALGSDYNLFAVGHIWQEARRRSLREAMLVALPRSSSAITTAGLALAASLGALALVPLRQFAELAFALVVGILIDTYLVRTLLVPALLTVVGPAAGWPGRRLRTPAEADAPPAEAVPSAPLSSGSART